MDLVRDAAEALVGLGKLIFKLTFDEARRPDLERLLGSGAVQAVHDPAA